MKYLLTFNESINYTNPQISGIALIISNPFPKDIRILKYESKENFGFIKPDLSAKYFISRIPFLKTFENISSDKCTAFQKIVYNSNITIPIGNDLYTFPNFNIVSEFYYSKYQRSENMFDYTFSLNHEIIISKPKNMDNLLYSIINIAENKISKDNSFTKEFINEKSLSEEDINKVINDINGNLFKFEDYIMNKIQVNLKNPFD